MMVRTGARCVLLSRRCVMSDQPKTITVARWIVLHDKGQATPAIGVKGLRNWNSLILISLAAVH